MREVRLGVGAVVWMGMLAGISGGAVRVSEIFGDHMVLQQRAEAPIWGWARPGQMVRVEPGWADGRAVEVKADERGRWRALMGTPEAGGPYEIAIRGDEGEAITIADVLIGEVWLCSGQSNMAWTVNQAGEPEEVKAGAERAGIRLFTVEQQWGRQEKEEVRGRWEICSSATVGDFTAVGYHFGRKLHEELGVAVGLINSSWGGTPAETWTSAEGLGAMKEYERAVELIGDAEELARLQGADWQRYPGALARWEAGVAAEDRGIRERWYGEEVDTSGWGSMELPRVWRETELEGFDGCVWFRRTIEAPAWLVGEEVLLELGVIDDIGTVWVNGIQVGTIPGRIWEQSYRLPAGMLREGGNVIAVRVIDRGWEGGFRGGAGQMRVGTGEGEWVDLAGQWRYQASQQGIMPAAPHPPDHVIVPGSPVVVYNGMIAPLRGLAIAGVAWYQGGNNVPRPLEYRELFPALIQDWRRQWGREDLPFYFVQLTPYAYPWGPWDAQYLREAQMLTWKRLENVGMAVTMDVGERMMDHPPDKATVGERLALWALAKQYGREVVYSGPLYREMKIEEGQIRVYFDYVDGGLQAAEGRLGDFVIAGADRRFRQAEARIEGETVVVRSEAVSEPVAVRYAWKNWVEGSLFNGAGLPGSPFRTDDWATISDQRHAFLDLVAELEGVY